MALAGTNKYGQSLADIQKAMKANWQANRSQSGVYNNAPKAPVNKYADEARRKALAGQALTDPSNKANQAIYDNTRSQMGGLTTDRYAEEAVRKANAGVALQNPNNATNQAVYKQAQQSGSNNVFDVVKALNESKNREQPVAQGQSANQFNSNSLIDSIYNNSRDAQLQALRKAQETAQQSLNREETGAKQHAYDARNQADVTASQNAQRLREAMANMGLSSSGDNLTLQAGQNAQRQGDLGSINRDEGNRLQNILEQRGVIDNNMAKDEQALIQQLNAVRAQQQLRQAEADRQFGLQEGGLTGNYQGQQTLAGLQNSQQYGLQQGALTGQYQGSPTLAGQQFQYGQQRDNVMDQRYNDQFQYQQTRDQRNDYESDRLFEYGSYRDNVGDQKWQTEFQQAVKNQAQQLGYNYASLNQRERQMMAEQTARTDDKAYSRMQDQFTMGIETYKQTGQMPSFMENFGINTKGFNNDATKEAVSVTYDALSSGEMSPEDVLKRADFELQNGMIDKVAADEIKNTVYYLHPESSPASVAEQKAKQEKRQKLIQDTYDFATYIPSVNITNKIYEWGKGLFN